MRAFGVGEVIETLSEAYAVGDFVTGFTGVQSEGVFTDKALRKIDISIAPAQEYLSGLGMTGYTAYFGMMDIGQPQAGQSVVVSAASGAVGSIAAQLARNAGARVIGIAGGAEKTAYLRDKLQLAGVIDYKAGNVNEQMRELAPDGVDIYFDNVGGEILDAALRLINYQGTIVLCGGISQYGNMYEATGPKEYLQMVMQSIRMQGFTMRDYMHRIPEAIEHLCSARADGKLLFREHVLEGIESFPDAFAMLFAGENHGKLLLKL
jgi:NADPH-dependent curcumin reductase CurA